MVNVRLPEIGLADDRGNDGHHEVVDEGVDDRGKREPHDERDRELDDVAPEKEVFELFDHGSSFASARLGSTVNCPGP
jgi:hypothetical protein